MKKAGVAPYRRVYGLKSLGSKDYKNVEAITIETFEGDKRDTPKDMLEFVAELFAQVGADRKESVDSFHKIIISRKQDPALLASTSGADSEVVLIGTDSSNVETVAVTEAAPKSTKAEMAKKYSL